MEKKIKWGVLGYARIARQSVIPAIVKANNSEFYAIGSRHEEKLKECQENFGCPKAYSGYDELLDDPEVDAVYIPLPNSLHKEWTIKAARKGKHVLCEKPIALNTEECLEMIRECKQNNVKLMEAFMYRYTHRTKSVKELLDSKVIGDVKHISSSFRFLLTRENDVRMLPELGGGALFDVGCYPISFLSLVTGGKEPLSMSAQYELQNGVDVSFSALMKYEGGITASISCGFNSFLRANSEIIGTKGAIEIPDTFFPNAGVITLITADGRTYINVREVERYVPEVEDFAEAIIHDREPGYKLDETLMNIGIIERLLKQIKE
mgnify:CR=1 FL=1